MEQSRENSPSVPTGRPPPANATLHPRALRSRHSADGRESSHFQGAGAKDSEMGSVKSGKILCQLGEKYLS